VICDNQWTGIYCESSNGFKTTLSHCVIARNRYCGIMLAGTSNVLIHSCVFFDNRQYAVFFGSQSQRCRVEYNDFYLNRAITNRQGALSATNVALDPKFPAVAVDDYDFTRPLAPGLATAGNNGEAIGILGEAPLAPEPDHAPDTPLDSAKQ
jgi:hypothetical protein